jgi:hypothetical protein
MLPQSRRLLQMWVAGILATGACLIDFPTLHSARGRARHHAFPKLPNANARIRRQVHRNMHWWQVKTGIMARSIRGRMVCCNFAT